MIGFATVLMVLAAVGLFLEMIKVPNARISFGWAGMFLWALAVLVGGFGPHIFNVAK